MAKYFSLIYEGPEFQLFGAPHLTAIAVIALFCLSFVYFRKVWGERERKYVRWTMAIALVVNELSLHIWSAYWGIWDVRTLLPLHLCTVILWLAPIMLVAKNYAIYEFVYFLGIGGATQAVLTPADAANYNFPHFRIMQTFIAHGLLIAIAVYMTVVEGFRPTPRSFWRVVIGTNVYMIPVFFINQWLGSNYLFIAGKPDFPTLLDAFGPWPWYILQMEAVGFAILFLLYLPFLIQDRRVKRQSVTA